MHAGASPVVPCAQLITGQPPAGGIPLGTAIVPETARSFPSAPVVWYSTSVFEAALGSAALVVNGRAQITVPCGAAGSGLGGV